jgi:hypothetical protein
VRARVAHEGGRRWDLGADPLHPRDEFRIGLHLGRRPAVALSARGEDRVVALAPHGHRHAAADVVRPREPGRQQDPCSRDRTGADEPVPGCPRAERRRDSDERRHDDEDGADERQRRGERRRPCPRERMPALPGEREQVHAREHEQPCERLSEDERHVVLRPGIDRVEQAGEERDAVAEPAPHRHHQQQRAASEEDGLPEQRGRVVAVEDRLLAEEREVERVPGRPERLPFGCLPRGLVDPRAGDVEPTTAEDEVEARL